MPSFISEDPREFLDPDRSRYLDILLHHESGHLLLAYHYGFLIGGLRYLYDGRDLGASVRNKPSPAIAALDPPTSAAIQTRKLLAGEIAGRIRAGIQTDQITLGLESPKSEEITSATTFDELNPTRDQRHDAVRVLGLINHHKVPDNWWEWIWARHAETEILLKAHWPLVEQLAARLKDLRVPDGTVDGDIVIGWCREFGVPLNDQANPPQSYVPDR